MVTVEWEGGMAFAAMPPSGSRFVMDAYPESGGSGLGPTPLETLLGAVAACGAMDVIAILKKKQQKVTGYRIEVSGERAPEGQLPRPYVSLTIRHIVSGDSIDPAAVERAVELSDQKYCSVVATLRQAPQIKSEIQIEQDAAALT